MRCSRLLLATVTVLIASTAASGQGRLRQMQDGPSAQETAPPPLLPIVGDDAPPLRTGPWVRGEPLESLDRGELYVVQFWRAGDPAGRMTLPYMEQLARESPRVTFVTLAVGEFEPEPVEAFLKSIPEPIRAMRIACDGPLEPADMARPRVFTIGRSTLSASAWLPLFEGREFPAAAIVNADGVVAWVGGPMRIGPALAQIQAGTHDLAAARSVAIDLAAAAGEAEKAQQELLNELQSMGPQDRSPERIEATLRKLIERYPAARLRLLSMLFKHVWSLQRFEDAYRVADELAVLAHERGAAQTLNELAWTIVGDDLPEPQPKVPDLVRAKRYAMWAVEASDGTSGAILDTLARAQFLEGDLPSAIENQSKALLICAEGEEKSHVVKVLAKYKSIAATRPAS